MVPSPANSSWVCVHGPMVSATSTPRCLAGRTHHGFLGPQLPDAGPDPARILLMNDQVAPPEEVVDGERPRTPGRQPHVVWARDDHAGDELRWGILQQRELSETEIRD